MLSVFNQCFYNGCFTAHGFLMKHYFSFALWEENGGHQEQK